MIKEMIHFVQWCYCSSASVSVSITLKCCENIICIKEKCSHSNDMFKARMCGERLVINHRIKWWLIVKLVGQSAGFLCCKILLTVMAEISWHSWKKLYFVFCHLDRSLFEIGLLSTRLWGCWLMRPWGPIAPTDGCKQFEWKREIKHGARGDCCSTIHFTASGLGPVQCLQCSGGEEGPVGKTEDGCAPEWTLLLNQIQPC